MTPPASPPRLLTHGQARGLAESIWGTGGTTAYRTNRAGAFYFSCSGHGGFVIDGRTLTSRERDLLTEAGFTADACWGIRGPDRRILTIRHPHSQVARPRKVSYDQGLGEYPDTSIPVWILEEDCDWAAVYAFTGIRAPAAFSHPEAEMITYARESLGRWYPKAAQVAARIASQDSEPASSAARSPAWPGAPPGGGRHRTGAGRALRVFRAPQVVRTVRSASPEGRARGVRQPA